jgi:3-hydroxyacyl-[acyl-carrier-protein] dehydratase
MSQQPFLIVRADQEQQSVTADVQIDAAHEIFRGHFPGAPVTPGVIQLRMVQSVLESVLGKTLRLKTIRTCKFLSILNPVETATVHIQARFAWKEQLEVTASGEWEGKTFFKVQATYQ